LRLAEVSGYLAGTGQYDVYVVCWHDAVEALGRVRPELRRAGKADQQLQGQLVLEVDVPRQHADLTAPRALCPSDRPQRGAPRA
jgi:hypothetical protein